MLTRIAFVVAIVLSLLSLVFSDRGGIYIAAVAAVCFAAVLAAIEAGRAGRYIWLAGLIVLAAVLNPVMPLALSPAATVLVMSLSFIILTAWMVVLSRTVPSQSIAQVLYPQDPK
jgi:hypothetical protein